MLGPDLQEAARGQVWVKLRTWDSVVKGMAVPFGGELELRSKEVLSVQHTVLAQ